MLKLMLRDMLEPGQIQIGDDMKRRTFVLSGAALASALAAHAQTGHSKLIVQVSYTGSGKVDESHKVYVVLWDNPDFVKGSSAPPIAIKSVTSKSATAEFDDVQKNPIYVSMVYDPTGQWDAMSPPPAGSSLGLYMQRSRERPIQSSFSRARL
jgi:hypothetical protein